MNQNCIYSSVHPEELIRSLKKGLPFVLLGLAIGLYGEMWLKPDPFTLIGILVYTATFACLIYGFWDYYQLKKANRYPILVEWENGALFIQGLEKSEVEIPMKNVESCEFKNRKIVLTLKEGKIITLEHFSERASERLKSQIAIYRAS